MSAQLPGPVLDAMREWCSTRTGQTVAHLWAEASEEAVRSTVERCYVPGRSRGGVSAFLRDHGNEGGEGR